MSPVVCFYQDDQYFYSDNYTRLDIPVKSLPQIQKEYFNQIKILQVDFEGSVAHIFVLHAHKIISKKDLPSTFENNNFKFSSHISKNDFIEKVKKIKKDIEAGRYYQVNFTSSFSSAIQDNISSFEVFKFYLNQFHSQYSAFIPLKDSEILCFSPELFLEKINTQIKTCPIKGTASNDKNFSQLIQDEKEEAELSMIVDLLRNDLQSVCNQKVIVTAHRQEMNLNYVTHTYSEVTGTTSMQMAEILSAMLPAGSISGCPKKESVLAIHELETSPRSFYTGCIGWWKENDFKLNLAIRSFLRKKNQIIYYTGCGIVYDSDPEKEWLEFHHKAKHLGVRP